MKKINVAFDIDDTLWKVVAQFPLCTDNCTIVYNVCQLHRGKYHQVPDYELIQVLKWFYNNNHNVYVWSAGGIEYAQQIINKLGLTEMVTVIQKNNDTNNITIDIAFDDADTNLAKVDVKVKRDD